MRVYDEDNSILNEVNFRLGEDRRMLREDGFLIENDSVVSFSFFWEAQDYLLFTQKHVHLINRIFWFEMLHLTLFYFEQGDVYCFSSLEDAVRGCQFVLESVPENLELKQNLFKS